MWKTDWPTEPGYYWFYGWLYGRLKMSGDAPTLYLLQMREGLDARPLKGFTMYGTTPHVMDETVGAIGKWQKINWPQPPEEMERGEDANMGD